ncbi:senescence-associated protein AAF, chlorolplastic isoform X4 [Benincasa hispida]|uniref:senescence-associated protein AAF, chlorolplastic isoform X4 n=1 Tax=Benincasa hispida TaxID=102211 RepID=UPI001900C8A1|nr:senescence-associated protein AAF, chlorolplastic isoform X4 [Benincasa hispida]
MALAAIKVSSNPVVTSKATVSNSYGVFSSLSKSERGKLNPSSCRVDIGELHECLLTAKVKVSNHGRRNSYGKPWSCTLSRRPAVLCFSTGTHHSETEECARPYDSSAGLRCGIMRLDARARQDVAILGSKFLKLDARAREDTETIDRNVKKKAERLRHIATTLREKAQSRLKTAADEHWSDGALEADLRLADFRAKQRAMEDALMALEFVKNIHDMMVRKMYKFPLSNESAFPMGNDMMGRIKLEKNGKSLDFLTGELSTDRISAIQEIYWSMASALSEADGIDYTDPEELELLIRTLMDLDAMDGKSSVSLLAECSSSPDENTRQALANALAAAPSMWTLGNAGMGALQRLAEDSNPAIATAASNAIKELKNQWEIEEGDSWSFTVNQKATMEGNEADDDEDDADPL